MASSLEFQTKILRRSVLPGGEAVAKDGMGGRKGRMTSPGMRAARGEEFEGDVAPGPFADDRDDIGAQHGAGPCQGMIRGIACAAQHEGGIAAQRVPRESDDLEEIGPRRHQAVSGL